MRFQEWIAGEIVAGRVRPWEIPAECVPWFQNVNTPEEWRNVAQGLTGSGDLLIADQNQPAKRHAEKPSVRQ
jgi:hypothetical protein